MRCTAYTLTHKKHYYCDEPRGHKGDHKCHAPDGRVTKQWANVNNKHVSREEMKEFYS